MMVFHSVFLFPMVPFMRSVMMIISLLLVGLKFAITRSSSQNLEDTARHGQRRRLSSSTSSTNSYLKQTYLEVPDIFIIGAQKCGTTSLNELLDRHPQICKYGVKEKHFFSETHAFKREADFKHHLKDYLAEFMDCTNSSQKTIDATPSYVWIEQAPQILKSMYHAKDLAKKKFILLLRDPGRRYVLPSHPTTHPYPYPHTNPYPELTASTCSKLNPLTLLFQPPCQQQ